ncbi:MAG: hypothetical protein JWN86_2515 [Planctomycetota bacterium]|nr:hypothetical protein [Planctomycetota bacterium]
MTRNRRVPRVVRMIVAVLALTMIGLAATSPDGPSKEVAPRPSAAEARERARLLHDTIHDTLQLVHAQYYREDEGLMIPAASLKHVFQRIADRNDIKLRWLVVDGRAMNIDHNPKDEFETEAVKALASGKDEHEVTAHDIYRHAGAITLKAECLKCHLPSRMSNKSRTAGLVISIPVAK